jgi:hypothetical protein
LLENQKQSDRTAETLAGNLSFTDLVKYRPNVDDGDISCLRTYRANPIVKPVLTLGFDWEQEEELSDRSPVVEPMGVALGPLLSPVVSLVDDKM